MAENTTNIGVGVVTGDLSKIKTADVSNGRIYFSKSGELFYDWGGARTEIQEIIEVATHAEYVSLDTKVAGKYYYVTGSNQFYYYDGTNSTLINEQTTVGDGTLMISGGSLTQEEFGTWNQTSDSELAFEGTGSATIGIRNDTSNGTKKYTVVVGATTSTPVYPNNFSNVSIYATSTTTTPITVIPDSSKASIGFIAGTNVTLSGNNSTKAITINAADTTYIAGTNINITGSGSPYTISSPNTLSKINCLSTGTGEVEPGNFDSSIVPSGGNISIKAGDNVSIGTTASNEITISAKAGVIGIGISTIQAITSSEYNASTFTPDPSTVYIVTADLS